MFASSILSTVTLKLHNPKTSGYVIWSLHQEEAFIFKPRSSSTRYALNLSVRNQNLQYLVIWSLLVVGSPRYQGQGAESSLSVLHVQAKEEKLLFTPFPNVSHPLCSLPLQLPDLYEVAPTLFAPYPLPTFSTPSLTSTRVLRTVSSSKVSELSILVYILASPLMSEGWRAR